MDIILHVGAHRTGTTTFQAYLRRNRERLAELAVAVLEPERMRGGLANGLIGPPGPMTPEVFRKVKRSTGLLKIELARLEQAGFDRLLVSEENLIGSVRENLRQKSLYAHATGRLARFSGVFGSQCSRIVIGVRSYELFWSSAMAYAIPMGWPMPSEADLDRFVTQNRRWRQVILDVGRIFPLAECVVAPFEAVMGRPEALLSSLLGEPLPGMEAARRWLHSSPTRDMLRQALIDRGDRAAAAQIPEGAGRWQPFAPHHIDSFRAQYAEDMAWLQAGAGGAARLIEGVEPPEVWLGAAAVAAGEGAGDDGWQRAAGMG